MYLLNPEAPVEEQVWTTRLKEHVGTIILTDVDLVPLSESDIAQ